MRGGAGIAIASWRAYQDTRPGKASWTCARSWQPESCPPCHARQNRRARGSHRLCAALPTSSRTRHRSSTRTRAARESTSQLNKSRPKSRLLVAAPTCDRVHTMLTRIQCLGISVRSNRSANGSESRRAASESVAQATRACACTRLPCTHAAKEAWPQFGLSENTAYSGASVG